MAAIIKIRFCWFVILLLLCMTLLVFCWFSVNWKHLTNTPYFGLNSSEGFRFSFGSTRHPIGQHAGKDFSLGLEGFQIVLFYNCPKWFPLTNVKLRMKLCPYNNCHLTIDRTLMQNASAVIFHYPNFADIKLQTRVFSMRPSNQTWVFFGMESPANINVNQLVLPMWSGQLNWSMSYRLDSDVHLPYGILYRNSFFKQKNYSSVFRKKSKLAAWIVSNCKTQSKREVYVKNCKVME